MGDALVLIDVQNPYAASNPKTVAAISDALIKLRQKMPVIWVFMGSHDEPVRMAQLRGRRLRDVFQDGAGYGISPALYPQGHDYVILKNENDAFTNPHFADALRQNGIRTVNLAGFHAMQCVLDSAKGAVAARFHTRILRPLTAEYRDSVDGNLARACKDAKIPLVKGRDFTALMQPVLL